MRQGGKDFRPRGVMPKRKRSRGDPISRANAVAVFRSPFIQRERRAALTYFDLADITTTSGSLGQWIFRANSIFDPDFTFTGHQPMLYDQIAPMYQSYKVIAVRVHYTCTLGLAYPIGLLSVATYNLTPPTQMGELVEFSRRPPRPITQYETASSNFTVRISSILGLKEEEYVENARYNTAIGSNPSDNAFLVFSVGKGSITGSDTLTTIQVMLEFQVIFYNPKDPGQS